MLKAKKIVYLIIGLFVLIVALLFLDWKTTYLVEVQQEDVQVFNEQIVIEMSSGTSMGYFKEAKLVLICEKVYAQDILEENFINKDIVSEHYQKKDFHTMYIGLIKKVLINEN